jgi:glucose-6-phosphate 1-dehydrogenase
MQFCTQETETAGDVLEAYERLILDAMRGDHTLFTTAEGIESLWARSEPLLADPPPVKIYPPGTWDPTRCINSSRRMLGESPSNGRGARRRAERPRSTRGRHRARSTR